MPINRGNQIIFIHIPKNAGTSIAKTLNMYSHCHKENKEVMYGIDEKNIVLQSLPLRYFKNYLPEDIMNNCFIFTIVRNPYDRSVSDYCWSNRGCKTFYDYLLLVKKIRSKKSLDELIKFDIRLHFNHFVTQKESISCDKYKIHKVMRFENLNEEFKKHFGMSLVHVNKSKKKKKSYKDYYIEDPRCKKLVYEIYNEDFVEFGYDKNL